MPYKKLQQIQKLTQKGTVGVTRLLLQDLSIM